MVFNSRERYEIKPETFNSKESDFGAFTNGGMIYFASSRKEQVSGDEYGWNEEPWLDLFIVKEDTPESIPEAISGDVNTKFHESSLVFSTDYKNDTVIYFTRNNFYHNKKTYGSLKELNLKIFRAEKENGQWKVNQSLPINSDYYSTGHPFVNADRSRIYYTSDKPGGFGGTDIYYSKIHPRGGIGKPINAGPLVNTEGNEMFPFVNNEGTLFFSSDGHVGFGQMDIFTTVMDEQDQIVDIINLGTPINSTEDDFAYFAHEDGITGYISSNRDGGLGSDDIYKFRFTPELSLEGYVTDGVNNMPLDSVKITLFDQKTGKMDGEAMSDANGYYRMYINRERNYVIEAVSRTHPTKMFTLIRLLLPLPPKLFLRISHWNL